MLITIFAVTFAVQEHKDRVLSEEITESASELQETGVRITRIRDVDMKDMNDYVRAFSEIAPLLDTYGRELHKITDLYIESRVRERSLLRVNRLFRKPHLTNWDSLSEILDITRALSNVMRQESAVIQNMAQLPERERMQFWHEQYLPLEAQEKGLRARLFIVGQRMSPAEQ